MRENREAKAMAVTRMAQISPFRGHLNTGLRKAELSEWPTTCVVTHVVGHSESSALLTGFMKMITT
jgi:hypothetical protein